MTLDWKVVIDSTDPHAQATFWGEALGYLVEDHSVLIERLLGFGAVPEDVTLVAHDRRAWRDLAGVRHPDDPYDKDSGAGLGRRFLFQRVPEAKTVKNRLHLDVHAGPERREAEVERLVGLGATVLREVAEQGGTWVVLTDPEGNEFCVQ
ncbi:MULTISPECIES: VOC family protein [unclassified Streptomyces]|uniref:VOC family protein n=1 Tax=unclassified Streptomyces TaxID=2593676 RepID=UPI000F5C14AC|nr:MULTISPECIES: VOC family protein [unclassified Streptomyces]WSG52688.1 VOC family protein [Streptomyces sp. NBC_01732]WSX03325.1 VOC family protein [Streptomyces sp. NBC_00987]MCX4394696.1 VOC family protein [Streptomyces sp. NBC_01767]MCX5102651.1 VOC family protein [Streptomyces sp. NBC_00439]MCX5162235.1 VOC family protein [Streptomyces sp. NBC_00305]